MKTILFKKMILAALVFTLVLAAFPLTSASAAGQTDDPLPPGQGRGLSNARLERVWARMNHRYERLGKYFDTNDELAGKANKMIDRLKEAGESTTELEAALKAYEAALKQAQPVYASCKDFVTSHKGFDDDGKVTDVEQAKETLKDFRSKMGDVRETMDGRARELIELMQSIREKHKPADSATGA